MRIAEIYASVQGEGMLTGTPSVFIRVSGCNLRCSFCDTPYASWRPEGESMSIDEIVETSLAFDIRHVVITGGEPMIFREISVLTDYLTRAGRHITIETAGTALTDASCDLISISPKLSNSTPSVESAGAWSARHENSRLSVPTIRELTNRHDYQFKFVVASPADVDEVVEFCEQFSELRRDRLMLMPEGVSQDTLIERETWLRKICQERNFVFCPRKQIEWYGARRGT